MVSRREFLHQIAVGTPTISLLSYSPYLWGNSLSSSWEPGHLNHFPSRLYAFVFRTWDLQPIDKIAKFLRTEPKIIFDMAAEMGLPPQPKFTAEIIARNSMPTIFRLWDIIPSEQVNEFMNMTADEFKTFLMTDITYWHAIGPQPDGLTTLQYSSPAKEEHAAANKFRENIRNIIPKEKIPLIEEPFEFIHHLNEIHTTPLLNQVTTVNNDEILLDNSWVVRYPSAGEIVDLAVKDFLKFCKVVMERPLASEQIADVSNVPAKSILLQVVPEKFNDRESHRIEISPEKVEIIASDAPGIMRGLYFLEDEMTLRKGMILLKGTFNRETQFTPRYIFTYYEMYGDMLRESVSEFYPETYLQYLSHFGVNGIWLQGILHELVHTKIFPEFGKDSQRLIDRLNSLIVRAKKYGMGVYLYFNEPRGQSDNFYKKYPECKGALVESRGGHAMCTSAKVTQSYLVTAFKELFTLAPDLSGIFIITASENLTNCYSNTKTPDCPRCSKRKPYEVISEVINLIARGVKSVKPEAEVIAWDWSWHNLIEEDPQAELIKAINPSVSLMADFERGTQIERGGIKTSVDEYCLSVVGPSPRAATRALQAKEKGTKCLAKLNLSTTWEMSAVPFLPIPGQVAEKFQNMRQHGFSGAMESWSVGGYPSINLEAAKEFYWSSDMTPQKAVMRVASIRYGIDLAGEVSTIWDKLKKSFSDNYPMTNGFIYSSPILWGTARNLYFNPLTKPYGQTRIWNPKDDNQWGEKVFPPEVQIALLEKMATDWESGARELKTVFDKSGILNRPEVQKDLGIIETIAIHFQSTANQINFNLFRNQLLNTNDNAQQRDLLDTIESIVKNEIELAGRHYAIARKDSRIGFESATQYFYRCANILEKIANCQYILQTLIPEYRKTHNL